MRILFACALVYLWPSGAWAMELVSHRGVHQALRQDKPIGNFQCTAGLIEGASHTFIENTIPSIKAAFESGADMVEIDIHLTKNNDVVVFHDFALDCRTNAPKVGCQATVWQGASLCMVENHDMPFLKSLDAGFNYTTDGGKTFPLRGKGISLIPSLRDVLDSFPRKKLLLDHKGDKGDTFYAVAKILSQYPPEVSKDVHWYGLNEAQERRVRELMPSTVIWVKDKDFYKSCYVWLVTTGWFGSVPEKCRKTNYGLPFPIFKKLGHFAKSLIHRVHAEGGKFYVFYVETPEDALALKGFDVDGVFTNHIEVLGPHLNN